MFRIRKYLRIIAVFLVLNTVSYILFPTLSYGLTSGPAQPEFSSFEPVATTNMVNEFSGDFTYNIPLLEVPGPHGSSYPLSLSYHSGVRPEEEASWVGYGWSLNPGSINRNTRGFPDDYYDQEVIYHNKTPENKTISARINVQAEAFSVDFLETFDPSASLSYGIRYNNYRGFGKMFGLGMSVGKGLVSVGFNSDNGEGNFSLNISPMAIMNWAKDNESEITVDPDKMTWKKMLAKNSDRAGARMLSMLSPGSVNVFGSQYGIFTYAGAESPTQVTGYKGSSANFSLGFIPTMSPLPLGLSANISGNVSKQTADPETPLDAFGFLYSDQSYDDLDGFSNNMMDYYVEKETPFNKRDLFIGIPFSTADNFTATAEGLGGGFKLYKEGFNQFVTNEVESKTNIFNLGFELEIGANIGGGIDIGDGYQTLSQGPWTKNIESLKSNGSQAFMRFNNDLGANMLLADQDDEPVQADLKSFNSDGLIFLGNRYFEPKIQYSKNLEKISQKGSSSIVYHTNEQILTALNSNKYGTYSHRSDVNAYVSRNEDAKLIGEVAISNESGVSYHYSLPVFSSNEQDIQWGAQGIDKSSINPNLVFAKNEDTKIGESRNGKYATAYLLTEIVNSDYIDRTFDGPTKDDFGGYTRFNYKKNNDSYNWRMPFKGGTYHRNQLSDVRDDVSSVSEGDKQIYYVQSVETKSHVAVFRTSSREDGREAPNNPWSATATAGNGAQEKLDRIDLYAISEIDDLGGLIRNANGEVTIPANATPIKTVHFKYNYGLSESLPNHITNGGKLTLESIHFTYQNKTTKISPYQFKYEYPDYTTYPSKYRSGGIDNVTNGYEYSSSAQNPSYNVNNSDAWGYFQAGGEERRNNLRRWVDQKENPQFDPAAWHLKVIKLPSGGEIHVQYEQDDYSYVQDQSAHVLANITGENATQLQIDGDEVAVYIDPNSIGVEGDDISLLEKLIQKQYVTGKEKMYFKFLFVLDQGNFNSLDDCNIEHLAGYVSVKKAEKVNRSGRELIKIDFDTEDNQTSNIPFDLCIDYVRANRIGNLDSDCNAAIDDLYSGTNEESLIRQLANNFGDLQNVLSNIKSNSCQAIIPEYSYLKIPTPNSKKGGGVRVKRLMTYTSNAELNADPVLFGNEYLYLKYDSELGKIRSSGVATNEPAIIREENALVKSLPRKRLKNKIIAGKDKKQSEGPIGETALPGPSVGYSRIVMRNIHSGKSQPGFSVSEYFTAKDYPVKVKKSSMQQQLDSENKPIKLSKTLVNNSFVTQGFSIVRNGLHGTMKSNKTYAGEFSMDNLNTLDQSALVTSIENEYYKPGENIPVISERFDGVELTTLGKEMDLTIAHKSVRDVMFDISLEGDADVGFFGFIPIPFITAWPSFTHNESQLYTHATTKVIDYPAVLKSTISYRDGIYHEQQNLAFDKNTGKAVIVKSFDEFSGTYVSEEIPGSWEYSSLQSKSVNEGDLIKASATTEQMYNYLKLKFNGNDACEIANSFAEGDVIEIIPGAVYHVSFVNLVNNSLKLIPSKTHNGVVPPTEIMEVSVLRSGRKNMVGQYVGNTVTHQMNDTYEQPLKGTFQRWLGSTDYNLIRDLNSINFSLDDYTLNGTYQGLNISDYQSCMPVDCQADLFNATVSDLRYFISDNGDEYKLDLVAFRIDCDGDGEPETYINCGNGI